MKKSLLGLAALCLLLCTMPANAATTSAATTPTPAATAQQNKMKTCAAQYHAKNIPKSQYRTFMSGCLKNPAAAPAVTKTPSAKTAL